MVMLRRWRYLLSEHSLDAVVEQQELADHGRRELRQLDEAGGRGEEGVAAAAAAAALGLRRGLARARPRGHPPARRAPGHVGLTGFRLGAGRGFHQFLSEYL